MEPDTEDCPDCQATGFELKEDGTPDTTKCCKTCKGRGYIFKM